MYNTKLKNLSLIYCLFAVKRNFISKVHRFYIFKIHAIPLLALSALFFMFLILFRLAAIAAGL